MVEFEAAVEKKRISDLELITQFQQGNVIGFNELVRRYQEKVYWIARRIVIDHDDADDVTQDVFVKVFKALKNFRKDSEFFTWLYRITTNISLNFLRAKKLKHFLHFESEHEEQEFEIAGEKYSFPDTILEHKELVTIIERAVETLPHQQRAVFTLRFYEELSYDEISDQLKLSIGGLKANYFHAIKKIQKYVRNAMQ